MRTSRLVPGRLIAAPRLAAVVGPLAALGVVLAVVLLGDPLDPLARSARLGWVPEAWTRPVAGHWRLGFERSEFVPCRGLAGGVATDAGERWWADLDAERGRRLDRRLRALGVTDRDTALFVAWVGDVSPRGTWGHMGRYARALNVHAVFGVRPETPGDCDAALRDRSLFAVE